MKILVLGATGMLGHKVIQILSREHTVYGTVRKKLPIKGHPVFGKMNLIENIDALHFNTLISEIHKIEPDVIVNSIGIVKQLPEAHDPIKSISINSLFPHQLASVCRNSGIRLIHYSTDCVFSGNKGNYSEEDFPDANDLYGRTKLLGELNEKNCLTIRTSIIGRELTSSHGLIEWFLSQNGKSVQGFRKVIFSGLTTNAHAEILEKIIVEYPHISGLYHVSSQSISKLDLLNLVRDIYDLKIEIFPNDYEISDRSLNSQKFKSKTKIFIPGWREMIEEMHRDSTPYSNLRD